jgi:hypothetical protein
MKVARPYLREREQAYYIIAGNGLLFAIGLVRPIHNRAMPPTY